MLHFSKSAQTDGILS